MRTTLKTVVNGIGVCVAFVLQALLPDRRGSLKEALV
jgi:hypothetical protein